MPNLEIWPRIFDFKFTWKRQKGEALGFSGEEERLDGVLPAGVDARLNGADASLRSRS